MKILSVVVLALSTLAATGQAPSQGSKGPTYLPSVLVGDRFYLKIPTLSGDTILGFCDTGGGYTAIHPPTLEKLKLEAKVSKMALEGDTLNYNFNKGGL